LRQLIGGRRLKYAQAEKNRTDEKRESFHGLSL
jgi:hypothetical protein